MKYYGYISIRTGLTKTELRSSFANSKLYSQYLDMIDLFREKMLYISDDEILSPSELIDDSMVFSAKKNLQVDIMTSKRNGMHFKLDNIIKYAEEHPLEAICIVINSINAFGDSESIKYYYHKFRKHKIGILLPNYTRECDLSEYSTFNFAFEFRPQNELNRAYDLIEQLTDDDVSDNRGSKVDGYETEFRVALWLYELFKISEKVAVSMSGLSKNGFHLKADSYEQTQTYMKELKIMEKNFQISKYMKRNRPVPDNFDKLIRWEQKEAKKIQKNPNWKSSEMTSLERACIHCKVPMIFPIDYKRLILKMENGKKELARCIKMYDEDMLKKYDEWLIVNKDILEKEKEKAKERRGRKKRAEAMEDKKLKFYPPCNLICTIEKALHIKKETQTAET